MNKNRPPMIELWLSEAHILIPLSKIHRFSQFCSLLSVE
jgi:hypothetical protein